MVDESVQHTTADRKSVCVHGESIKMVLITGKKRPDNKFESFFFSLKADKETELLVTTEKTL